MCFECGDLRILPRVSSQENIAIIKVTNISVALQSLLGPFVLLNKQFDLQKGYSGIDELVYFGTVSKEKFARIFVSFAEESGKPVVTGISFLLALSLRASCVA